MTACCASCRRVPSWRARGKPKSWRRCYHWSVRRLCIDELQDFASCRSLAGRQFQSLHLHCSVLLQSHTHCSLQFYIELRQDVSEQL